MAGIALDLAACLALLAGGALGWARRPASRCGPLLVLAGAAWLAGDVASSLLYLHRGPLTHALLAHPAGRLGTRRGRIVVALAYVDGAVPPLATAEPATIALGLAVVVLAAARVHGSLGRERAARTLALACAAAVWGALAASAAVRLADGGDAAALGWAYAALVGISGVALGIDLARGPRVRAAVTGLVVDLGRERRAFAVRAPLARALGDPRLELAYAVDGEWVDERGTAVVLPAGGERAVTYVRDGEDPSAALVHDRAALSDPGLAAAVAAAVRLAVANVRMRADVEAQSLELAASSRRLLDAADGERRRLGEDIARGPEATVDAVARSLGSLAAARTGNTADTLTALAGDAAAAGEALRRFARGVHPPALARSGLATALAELAAQAHCSVAVDAPARRFPPALEAAAYFVCSEALANAAKHARATRVELTVAAAGDTLVVRVRDDGGGGADPRTGTGLRGLADRVEALGGRLELSSPAGSGTRLEARLPGAAASAPVIPVAQDPVAVPLAGGAS